MQQARALSGDRGRDRHPDPAAGQRRAELSFWSSSTKSTRAPATAARAGLVDGSRVSKSSARMAAIGEVDEANSAIGVAIAALAAGELADQLRRIQNEMFDLGADLATPFGTDFEQHALRIVPRQVERLEEEIDAMNASLDAADQLHPARRIDGGRRCSTRRAASSAAPNARRSRCNETSAVNADALAYLNRLSDHLFVAARASWPPREGGDVLWQPGATRDS